MIMKREREEAELDSVAMAKCLMLLSRVGEAPAQPKLADRLFACKTCNKKFASFQALGGHSASHKRPRLTDGDLLTIQLDHGSPPAKNKSHECSICGSKFALGQALGGHMRRHRPAADKTAEAEKVVPVLRRLNSKRVMGLDLNLNLNLSLIPYEVENDLELDLKLGHERSGPPIFNPFI